MVKYRGTVTDHRFAKPSSRLIQEAAVFGVSLKILNVDRGLFSQDVSFEAVGEGSSVQRFRVAVHSIWGEAP